jgi:hypothetical protein
VAIFSLAHHMIRALYARSSTTRRSTPRSCSTHPSTGRQLLANRTHLCPTLVATLSLSEFRLLGRTKQLLLRLSSLTFYCPTESCTSLMHRSMRLQATQRLQHLRMCHVLSRAFTKLMCVKKQVLVGQFRCDD